LIDLCAGLAEPLLARGRIFAWLAEGARELGWALCSLPRERWTARPPQRLGTWPVLRHARALALRERYVTLPAVDYALGVAQAWPSTATFEQAEAAWDARAAQATADALLRELGETRFELLQRLESAPDVLWQSALPVDTAPQRLDTLLLRARQHELEHLAAMWRIALYWDRVSPATVGSVALPLHPADRLEESH
jgi:hypothetical protein